MKKLFSETIKKLRTEKGLSQNTLADKLFVTQPTVARWESGTRLPDAMMMTRLAEVLGVSVEELLRVNNTAANEKPKKELSLMLAMPFKAIALAMGVAVAALSVLEKIDAKSAFIMLGIGLALLGITSLGEDK